MMDSIESLNDLARVSGVAFGTSGARGLVSAMTDGVCYGYTVGFLRHLIAQQEWEPGKSVALAGDLRPSTPNIIAACCAAVTDLGGKSESCGFIPTPAVALYALKRGMPSIMVTGSHIPDDRNGIKFYRLAGEILKKDERLIMAQPIAEPTAEAFNAMTVRCLPAATRAAGEEYVSRYVECFGTESLQGLKIGGYQHSAVGRDILVELLSSLGASVTKLGRSSRFVPVDTEAVRPADVELAREWAAHGQFDAIVSTDGDSDRPLLADECGEWLRGDVLAMLCARQLGMQIVVTPVSSNTVVERCDMFRQVTRTRIGSPYVIEAMEMVEKAGHTMICGYEANGGYLLGSDVRINGSRLTASPTRDAVLPILTVLAASTQSSVRQLVEALPKRATTSSRIQSFSSERGANLIDWLTSPSEGLVRISQTFTAIAGANLQATDETDGVRMIFENDRTIHLRQSGNAPELRLYAEAEDPKLLMLLQIQPLHLFRKIFDSEYILT